jgi:hypothetical protein
MLKSGFSVLLLVMPFEDYHTIGWFLLVILLVEMLAMFGRFRYLTRTSVETNRVARIHLTRYRILFGIRVIFGMFVPLVFITYYLFLSGPVFKSAAFLLIIGELIDKFLFVFTAEEVTDNSNIVN